MCLGELGVVIRRDPAEDVAIVRTRRGTALVTTLVLPETKPGDHVIVHSGHIVARAEPEEAALAAELRASVPDTVLEAPT